MIADVASCLTVSFGLFFFLAGTVGLLRFPDVHSRLHALTKADNLGLGFIVIGAAFQAADVWTVFKLLAVWLFTVAATATAAQLVARAALPAGRTEERNR